MSTPNDPPSHTNQNQPRSTFLSRSRTRTGSSPPPRPTTPLRPPSRTSFRSSHTPTHGSLATATPNPFTALEPAFAELSDSMADLEANFVHLQLMHESLSRFNECFASFLYGCNVNAFCVDFPEAPVLESFRRAREHPALFAAAQAGLHSGNGIHGGSGIGGAEYGRRDDREADQGVDQTFLTNETSFVENPPSAQKVGRGRDIGEKFATPGRKPSGVGRSARGGAQAGAGAGRGQQNRGRASGLARATGRGRGGTRG